MRKLLVSPWFLVLAIIVFIAFGLFIALKSYIAPSPTDFSQRKEFIQLLAQILGGALLLIGLYLTWRRVEVAQEGQITDRFTRAIEQLGSEKLEVRLGGIYALERIAKDSERDDWPIMEVLAAYVRENAPWRPKRRLDKNKISDISLSKDIQAIMTVIRRRERDCLIFEDQIFELTGTDLRGALLYNAKLQGAEFIGSHLEKADLRDIEAWGAHFTGAYLKEADLSGAKLRWADFSGAHLEEANLERVHLSQANLHGAFLKGAILRNANLESVDLRNVKGITKEQIKSAYIYENTKLADYLKAPLKSKKGGKQEGKKKGITSKRS